MADLRREDFLGLGRGLVGKLCVCVEWMSGVRGLAAVWRKAGSGENGREGGEIGVELYGVL